MAMAQALENLCSNLKEIPSRAALFDADAAAANAD